MMKTSNLKSEIYILILFTLIQINCNNAPKEIPIEVDSSGRVLKTFNGHLTKCYDTLGNLIEFYGYVNYSDWKGCVHDKIYYDNNGREIRRILYNFNNNDTICKITDSLDYMEYRNYYSSDGKLEKHETYKPIKVKNKVVDRKLVHTQY